MKIQSPNLFIFIIFNLFGVILTCKKCYDKVIFKSRANTFINQAAFSYISSDKSLNCKNSVMIYKTIHDSNKILYADHKNIKLEKNLKEFMLSSIRWYRETLSPIMPPNCRLNIILFSPK